MADKKEDAMMNRVSALEGNLSRVDQRVTVLENKPPSSGVADAILKDVEALRVVVNELKPTVDNLVKHVTAVDDRLRKIEARLKQLEQRPQPGH
jgi:chaperonin cofactor prefoldin